MKSLQKLTKRGISFIKRRVLRTTPPFLIKEGDSVMEAGRHSYHSGNLKIKGYGEFRIGSFCAIGTGVTIVLNNHNYHYPSLQYFFHHHYFGKFPFILKGDKVIIGNDVWIGDNAIILPGVTVGTGAIIAAGAIVTKDVEPYAIVGGNPAKFIKMRFKPEVVEELLELKWWEWSDQKIKENQEFFFTSKG